LFRQVDYIVGDDIEVAEISLVEGIVIQHAPAILPREMRLSHTVRLMTNYSHPLTTRRRPELDPPAHAVSIRKRGRNTASTLWSAKIQFSR